MKANITNEERFRRVLIAAYLRMVEQGVVVNLPLLDAMKDCIDGNTVGMTEWSVSKRGKVRWV